MPIKSTEPLKVNQKNNNVVPNNLISNNFKHKDLKLHLRSYS